MEELEAIISSDLPEAEKLVQAFNWVTGEMITNTRHDMELAQALNDQEGVIKAQIRLSVIEHTRQTLIFCQQRIRAQKGRAA